MASEAALIFQTCSRIMRKLEDGEVIPDFQLMGIFSQIRMQAVQSMTGEERAELYKAWESMPTIRQGEKS